MRKFKTRNDGRGCRRHWVFGLRVSAEDGTKEKRTAETAIITNIREDNIIMVYNNSIVRTRMIPT